MTELPCAVTVYPPLRGVEWRRPRPVRQHQSEANAKPIRRNRTEVTLMATVAMAPELPQPKSSIVVEVTIRFDTMTWADLRRFVALADRNHISDLDEVVLDFTPDIDDFEPIGLMFRTRDGDI